MDYILYYTSNSVSQNYVASYIVILAMYIYL